MAKPKKLKHDTTIKGKKPFEPPEGYKPHAGHGTTTSFSTTRKAQHRGHNISVRTTYRIEIDGEPLKLHTMVLDDGKVHCHGLPNYAFASAVELARAIIDTTKLAYEPKDELGGCGDSEPSGHTGHGHHHGGDH